jgi:hypothetical protein
MITKENIEAYLLDFLEGNLSQFEIKELMDFVALHPEYNNDLELESVPIDVSIQFPDKASLKKGFSVKPQVFSSLNANETELFIVAKIENELNEKEELHFNRALQADKNFEEQFKAFTKTIIPIDNSLIFENKEQLKRTASLAPIFDFRHVISYAAAASVVLFAGYLFFKSSPRGTEDEKTDHKKAFKFKKDKKIPSIAPTESKELYLFAEEFISFKPSLNIVLDSTKNVQKKVIPSSTELMAQETDSINNVKNENKDITFISPTELNQSQEMIENPEQEETLTVKSFFIQSVNQVLFGMKDPNEDEKYASISQRVSSSTGISFDLKRRKNEEFHLKIGKFSIDRKKSN